MTYADEARTKTHGGEHLSPIPQAEALDRLLALLEREQAGEDITFKPEYKRSREIGRLFQDPMRGTAPHMTIEENLALAYLRAGTAPNAIFSRISRKDKALFREKLALLDMGLEDRMKQPVGLLSGGQRQAVTLLMATMKKPKILLLDEPCSALDMKNTIAIEETLLELKGKYTFVIVTHNLAQAKRIADQIIFMDQGRVLEVTDTKTFFEHPSSEPAREQIQYM